MKREIKIRKLTMWLRMARVPSHFVLTSFGGEKVIVVTYPPGKGNQILFLVIAADGT